MNSELVDVAVSLNDELRRKGLSLSTAESCTGGYVAAAITAVPGSSSVFKGGVVAYSNEVKHDVLGVPYEELTEYGAVSEPVVRSMVQGVARIMCSDCAVATSGIAGPGGGTEEKPVGTVWVAIYLCGKVYTHLLKLNDEGRGANICTTSQKVLSLLLERMRES